MHGILPLCELLIFDDSQDGLCVYSASFSNGRISCRFSRTVDITDVNQDYYLNNMFHLLFAEKTTGSGTRSGGTGFSKHSMTPRISPNQVNPLQDSNARCPIQVTSISSHKPIFGIPSGCNRSSCDYYVGLSPNPVDSTYLDVYLKRNASGWIGIGFSLNTQMEEDDVLGCHVSSCSVTVVDTWNPSPRRASNQLDNTQNGLCVQSASFTNGRISCMFSRTIAITDVGQDYNLNNSYYLLFGKRLAAQSGTNLRYHRTPTPEISGQQYNPVLDSNIQTCLQPPPNDRVFTFRRGTTGSSYYFAARVNPDNPNYLDMTLEADTTGWVGIGFSTDRLMGNDDVLACHRSPSSDMVAVVDTWNPNPRYTSNQLDPNQNGVCTHSAQFINGRITCTFSRLIVGMQMDHNLNDNLFQLYATSSARGVGSLARHDVTPGTTTEPVMLSIANETAVEDFPKRQLTKVHGIFMLIAWPLLAVTAIFFAAWMKPAIPVEWFQVHRALMIISLFTTAIGLIFIFVANARNTAVSPGLINFACGTNTAHFIIGFIVFILQIVNPIIAIFRCKPNESRRWIFNIIHGKLFGFIAELFALINVGLGIALFESNGCGRARYTILWVYIVFVILLLIFQAIQFVVFTISTLGSPPEKQRELAPSLLKCFFTSKESVPEKRESVPEKGDLEMTDKKDITDDDPPPPPKKPPSADAPIRWITFAIFAAGTVVLIMVLAIMIAAA